MPVVRLYGLSRKWLWLMLSGGAVLFALGAGLGAAVWLGVGDSNSSIWVQLLFYALALLFSGAGIACFIFAFQFQVLQSEDLIRVRQYFPYREIYKRDVLGYRFLPTSPATMVLVPKDGAQRKVKLPLCLKEDEKFWEWFENLPSLDDEDREAVEESILSNEAFGRTETNRWDLLQQARRASRRLSLWALALVAWGLFYPEPYELAMFCVAATPWLGMAVLHRYRGLMRVDGAPSEIHPTAAAAIFLPGLILSLRVLFGWQIVNGMEPLRLGAVLALTMFFILLKLDPTMRGKVATSILMLVFLMPYGYSSVVLVNGLWGDQPTEFVEARVVSKRISSDRHELTLEPWGSRLEESDVQVPRPLYDATEAGDTVCAVVRTGSLGIEWFTVQRCR